MSGAIRQITCIAFVISFAACSRVPISTQSVVVQDQNEEVFTSSVMDSLAIRQSFNGLRWEQELFRYYASRFFENVWWRGEAVSDAMDSLVGIIGRIEYLALPTHRYHQDELTSYLDAPPTDAPGRLRMDALLSDAFMSILVDVRYGPLPSTRDITENGFTEEWLDKIRLRKTGVMDLISSREPSFAQYHLLKKELKSALDTMATATGNNGIIPDSPNTERLKEKISRIEVNLHRWRIEGEEVNGDFIMVNIPAFLLYHFEDNTLIATYRVIVGKPTRPTPLVSSAIECVTVHPYWVVPRRIAVEEYLPAIQKDRTFLTLNRFEVLDRSGRILNADSLNWGDYNANYFPVVLRQKDGEENSLGILKFYFENPYAIYIHDTNAKYLFNREKRAFSHGCIRVERPVHLAKALLEQEDKIVSMETCIREKVRCSIDLPRPVPVFVRYFTCEVTKDGYQEHEDVYGRDEALSDALSSVDAVTDE